MKTIILAIMLLACVGCRLQAHGPGTVIFKNGSTVYCSQITTEVTFDRDVLTCYEKDGYARYDIRDISSVKRAYR